ncbi:MAG: TolB family protein, partial [Woeseiaceae bacterium]
DQEIDDLPELYLVDVANPGVSTKLSGAMVAGGTIAPSDFGFSPDGTAVGYIADQDTNGVNELYLVEVASPGASQKLNDALVVNGNVEHFAFTPDGAQVVYAADQDTDDVLELYLVDVATPEVSIKLSDAFVAGGNVSAKFAFDAGGARVIYRADQDTDEVPELYVVDTAMPGASMKVNETLVAGGEVSFNFAFTPDGTRIVYEAEQDADNVRDLYLVDAATPGASSKLSAPLVAGGMTASFAFTPDGTEVVYFADQDTDDVFEIYLAEIAAPGVSTTLNGPLPAGSAGTGDFVFLP